MTKQLELDVLALPAQDKLHLLHLLIDNLFTADKADSQPNDTLTEQQWDEWDKQIEADDSAGKLNFLFEEVRLAKENNQLREL